MFLVDWWQYRFHWRIDEVFVEESESGLKGRENTSGCWRSRRCSRPGLSHDVTLVILSKILKCRVVNLLANRSNSYLNFFDIRSSDILSCNFHYVREPPKMYPKGVPLTKKSWKILTPSLINNYSFYSPLKFWKLLLTLYIPTVCFSMEKWFRK